MTWTPPPGYYPPQPPPRSPAATFAWAVAILGGTVAAVAVGVKIIDQKADKQDVSLRRAVADAVAVEPEREARAPIRLVPRPPAPPSDPAETKRRIAGAKFTSTRFDGLDGQCKGKALSPFGYIVEGSTYADNVIVGQAVGCTPFGDPENNITNMFCCTTGKVPAKLDVSVGK